MGIGDGESLGDGINDPNTDSVAGGIDSGGIVALPLLGNLLGYYKFNTGSGTVAVDSSGNNNNGTLGCTVNAITYTAPSWVNIGNGYVLSCAGSSAVTVPIQQSQVVTAIFMVQDLAPLTTLLNPFAGTAGASGIANEMIIAVGSNTNVTSVIPPYGAHRVLQDANTVLTGVQDVWNVGGEWAAGVYVWNAGHNDIIQINNNSTPSGSNITGSSAASRGTNANYIIGAKYGSALGAAFTGRIGPCAFWNVALTQTQISQAFTALQADIGSRGASTPYSNPNVGNVMVLLGDSITNGANSIALAWANLFNAYGVELVNYGLGGAGMQTFENNNHFGYVTLTAPNSILKIAFFGLGTNDILVGRTLAQMQADFATLNANARSCGANAIIWMPVLSRVNEDTAKDIWNTWLATQNGGSLYVIPTSSITPMCDDGAYNSNNSASTDAPGTATINITSVNGQGGITGITFGTDSVGLYTASQTFPVAVLGGGGTNGIVNLTTNGSGVATGVSGIYAAGTGYSTGSALATACFFSSDQTHPVDAGHALLAYRGLNPIMAQVVAAGPTKPIITTQPSSLGVGSGGNATFTVAAVGPTPTVQWQTDNGTGGVTWTNLTNTGIYSGVTTTSLTLTGVSAGVNGYEYRAVFTNASGSTATNAATLTISRLTASLTFQGNGTTTSSSINTTGANGVMVFVCSISTDAATGVSDNKGNTYTPLTPYNAGFSVTGQLFYCASATTGTGHTFTVTCPDNLSFPGVVVAAFNGVAASQGSVVQNGTAASFASVTSFQPGSITPGQNGELIIAYMGNQLSHGTTTVDSGLNLIYVDVNGAQSGAALAWGVQSTAAAINPTFSWVNSTFGQMAGIASFK